MTEKDIALVLAKAHLDTLLTDYVIVGFDRKKEPLQIEDHFECGSVEVLQKLYELFINRTENKL